MTDIGASAYADRAGGLRPEPSSRPKALIPCAGGALMREDAARVRDAEKANIAFLNALEGAGPAGLVWTDHSRGNQWAKPVGATVSREALRAAETLAAKEAMRDRVVKRDPCAHCGVRGDLHHQFGCRRLAA